MKRKNLFLGSLFLSAALIAPMAMQARPAPQVIGVKIYDRDHKDYHVWDDREGHAYAQYRVEHPKVVVDFNKSSKKQQRDYWTWRHAHPDHD